MAVPVHHRHGVAHAHAQRGQRLGQPPHPLVKVGIGVAKAVGVDNFLLAGLGERGVQQLLDQQRIAMGTGGGVGGDGEARCQSQQCCWPAARRQR